MDSGRYKCDNMPCCDEKRERTSQRTPLTIYLHDDQAGIATQDGGGAYEDPESECWSLHRPRIGSEHRPFATLLSCRLLVLRFHRHESQSQCSLFVTKISLRSGHAISLTEKGISPMTRAVAENCSFRLSPAASNKQSVATQHFCTLCANISNFQ
jgi:hypothetical protein